MTRVDFNETSPMFKFSEEQDTMVEQLNHLEKIILVSNREPYIHEYTNNDKIKVKKAFGGLVTALDPLMQENGGTWIAWGSGSADFDVTNQNQKVTVPPITERYILKRIHLSDEEESLFYKGYANSVLWPLFHVFIEKMKTNEKLWNTYQKINQRFADAILSEIDEDTFVWIHDYHLALIPYFVKKKVQNAKIAYFWHIPWPPWEIFGSLPQRNEILTGLLHADILGFHTDSYKQNFLRCCKRKPDAILRNDFVHCNSQETKIVSLPLGIDYTSFAGKDDKNKAVEEAKRLKEANDVDSIILGIDRLDYTKGILNRLKAFEYFLETYQEFHEKVVLIQIATPSRYEIDEYFNMKKNIDETVGRINAKFRTANWTPVKYFFKRLPQTMLLAYYKVSDVALLTPLRDGMNLIAKEYIAARQKEGAIILSEFAGASEQLNEAIIVNPYDIPSTAEALKTAITMPSEERKNRFQELKNKVKKYNSSWWLHQFINEWDKRYVFA
jgi:trehalose 6-phosphate synthase/phosphatase